MKKMKHFDEICLNVIVHYGLWFLVSTTALFRYEVSSKAAYRIESKKEEVIDRSTPANNSLLTGVNTANNSLLTRVLRPIIPY